MKEYLYVSSTVLPDVFVFDCQPRLNFVDTSELSRFDELDFETSYVPKIDSKASLVLKDRTVKVRQLDRSVGDSLKRLYDYRCQMTGEKIGTENDALVVEAHHISPFTKSMNNDASNLIILSPNYHRIIHKANPQWDSSSLSFKFPNGLVEKVKLNKHL